MVTEIMEWMDRPKSPLKQECRFMFVVIALCMGIIAGGFGLWVLIDAWQTGLLFDPIVWLPIVSVTLFQFCRWVFYDD